MRRAWTVMAIWLAGCGTQNVDDCATAKKPIKCDKPTEDEQAQEAMSATPPDFNTAITLLNDLIAQEPTDYDRYPLLAAAYAGRAGFDILNLTTVDFSGSSDILADIGSFITCPAPTGAGYKVCVGDMKSACDVLRLIPADVIKNTADPYATSASVQLTLYAAAYPIMFLKEFTTNPATGTVDINQLKTMSPSDAVTFIDALVQAGQVPQVPGETQAVQDKINTVVTQIKAEPGATQQAQIAAFVAAEQGQSTGTGTDTSFSTGTGTGTSTGG